MLRTLQEGGCGGPRPPKGMEKATSYYLVRKQLIYLGSGRGVGGGTQWQAAYAPGVERMNRELDNMPGWRDNTPSKCLQSVLRFGSVLQMPSRNSLEALYGGAWSGGVRSQEPRPAPRCSPDSASRQPLVLRKALPYQLCSLCPLPPGSSSSELAWFLPSSWVAAQDRPERGSRVESSSSQTVENLTPYIYIWRSYKF